MFSNWLKSFALVIHFVYIKYPPFFWKALFQWLIQLYFSTHLVIVDSSRESIWPKPNRPLKGFLNWTSEKEKLIVSLEADLEIWELSALLFLICRDQFQRREPITRDGKSWGCASPGLQSSWGLQWRLVIFIWSLLSTGDSALGVFYLTLKSPWDKYHQDHPPSFIDANIEA